MAIEVTNFQVGTPTPTPAEVKTYPWVGRYENSIVLFISKNTGIQLQAWSRVPGTIYNDYKEDAFAPYVGPIAITLKNKD